MPSPPRPESPCQNCRTIAHTTWVMDWLCPECAAVAYAAYQDALAKRREQVEEALQDEDIA